MPSKSKAQHNLMEAVAHDAKFAHKAGIPQKVGKEFANADKEKESRAVQAAKRSKALDKWATK